MTDNRQVTFSISVPSALHLILGIILAVAAAAAFLIHLELPTDSPYRPTVACAGVVAAIATISFWLWCCIQRSRSETQDLRETVETAAAAAKARDDAVLTALVGVASTLTEIASEIANNGGGIKELSDAMDESTGAVTTLQDLVKSTAANVKVLQDLYLKEGRVLVFPETSEVPRDIV